MYRTLLQFGKKYVGVDRLMRWGFNLSPMYRRSTARVIFASKDLSHIRIRLPLSWKNRNYMGTIFGGSMFAAVDPIPMIQLVEALGDDYIVWDKAATIVFKRPGKFDLYADFLLTQAELQTIKNQVEQEQEIEFHKTTQLTNKAGDLVVCEVDKTIYIAQKAYYKAKLAKRKKLN